MEVAVVASLPAKRDMEIKAWQGVKEVEGQ